MDFNKFEQKIGYIFIDKDILQRALTRKALENESKCRTQENLSTLGDGLLRAILVDSLMPSYDSSGEITKKKIELEKNQTLSELGKKWLLDEYVITTLGEKKDQSGKNSRIADTVEAIIGAIYQDGGYEIAKKVVQNWYKEIDK
jgi:ribonuclease-3